MDENKIFLGSDHAGFLAKEEIKKIFKKLNYEFEDLGTCDEKKSVDYPDIAKLVCDGVLANSNSFGILICGSGTGMAIAANKMDGIRAAFSYDSYSAKMCRQDNDVNVLTLRSREFDHKNYENIIKTFLETKFSNEQRHIKRINKLNLLEKNGK